MASSTQWSKLQTRSSGGGWFVLKDVRRSERRPTGSGPFSMPFGPLITRLERSRRSDTEGLGFSNDQAFSSSRYRMMGRPATAWSAVTAPAV